MEAAAKVKGEQIGYPLKDALYRTNNPFSPEMMDYFSWGQVRAVSARWMGVWVGCWGRSAIPVDSATIFSCDFLAQMAA